MMREATMKAIVRALVVSRMHAAKRTDVVGLDGVSVSFDDDPKFSPRRIFVKFPNGTETCTDLYGETYEEIAAYAADYLGL